tara:strand:+ start:317 stop:463 length:147 start_codon:yes stop_codon:yes gene_type:complete
MADVVDKYLKYLKNVGRSHQGGGLGMRAWFQKSKSMRYSILDEGWKKR